MTQRLDNTTKTTNGQGSDGPDKSMATTLPYTQMGTPSTLANDGLLAGRELESDAELIALGWIKPPTTTLDLLLGNQPPCDIHGQRGCTDCARVALCAETGMCAEHLRRGCHVCGKVAKAAKKQADRRAWLAVFPDDRDTLELAADTGRIGNSIPKSGGRILYRTPLKNTTARFRPKPDKPRPLKCLKPQWGKGTDAFGGGYKIWHNCNDCLNCIANALNRKAWRWDVGRGPFQTSIMVTGAANADEARKWTGQLAKAVNIPNRASLVTPDGEILIVAADPLDADTIQRIRDFALADHGNCKRPAMQCVIKSENVQGVDLIAFVKGNRTAQGEQRHVSWVNKGAAFADGPAEDDFSLGDATPLADDEPKPTAVVLCSEVKQSRAWRKERNPAKRERMRLDARAEQARLWCDGKNLLTYSGPTKMLKQYADYCAGHRVYEPAWDYVAQL